MITMHHFHKVFRCKIIKTTLYRLWTARFNRLENVQCQYQYYHPLEPQAYRVRIMFDVSYHLHSIHSNHLSLIILCLKSLSILSPSFLWHLLSLPHTWTNRNNWAFPFKSKSTTRIHFLKKQFFCVTFPVRALIIVHYFSLYIMSFYSLDFKHTSHSQYLSHLFHVLLVLAMTF